MFNKETGIYSCDICGKSPGTLGVSDGKHVCPEHTEYGTTEWGKMRSLDLEHRQKEEQWMIDTKLLLEQIAKTLKRMDARARREAKKTEQDSKEIRSYALSLGRTISPLADKVKG